MRHSRTPEFATERRRHRRWNLPVAVRELRPESHILRATNISAGGLYCPHAGPRKLGENLLVEIDLGPKRVFVAAAKVIEATPSGLRLQFLMPQQQLELALRKLAV